MPKPGDHIVIVGGASGIGLALARSAHALGCRVTVTGRGQAHARQAAAAIGANVAGVALDLLDSASIAAAFQGAEAIDHLALTPVYPGNSTVRQRDPEEWSKAARVKLTGFLEVVNAALPRLRPTSSILLFGGLGKARPYPGGTMVAIVNGGVLGMMRTLALELAPIRVNAISPGLVADSPRWESRVAASPQAALMVEAARKRTPAGRLVDMADVVHAAFFLMDNRGVNGVDLEIDGGVQLVS